MKSVIAEHIEITPGICGGKPRIAGHRIRVVDIVILHERMKLSPEAILSHYPSITLADVHAALAYYYDNLEEIQQQMRVAEELADEMEAKIPSKVQQKLRGTDVANDSVPFG
jgi:uncharacterized protein (DUF433 family)